MTGGLDQAEITIPTKFLNVRGSYKSGYEDGFCGHRNDSESFSRFSQLQFEAYQAGYTAGQALAGTAIRLWTESGLL